MRFCVNWISRRIDMFFLALAYSVILLYWFNLYAMIDSKQRKRINLIPRLIGQSNEKERVGVNQQEDRSTQWLNNLMYTGKFFYYFFLSMSFLHCLFFFLLPMSKIKKKKPIRIDIRAPEGVVLWRYMRDFFFFRLYTTCICCDFLNLCAFSLKVLITSECLGKW